MYFLAGLFLSVAPQQTTLCSRGLNSTAICLNAQTLGRVVFASLKAEFSPLSGAGNLDMLALPDIT